MAGDERDKTDFCTNLTRDVLPLVGREGLLAAMTAAFDRGERLVTLVGPGGAGKTALASAWARAAAGLGLREAWFCDLSGAATGAELCHVVKVALGLANGANHSLDEFANRVGTAMAERGRILMVLDNFEHLVELASSTLGRWLQLAWDATFVVTSRQRLQLSEECVIEVGPLAEDDAVRLFAERAHAVDDEFWLDETNRDGVRRIVRRLDALPLAIQMVAPWVQTLSVDELAARIATGPDLLVFDDPCAPARHGSLEATVRWSWQQLSAAERDVLQQLARLFHGRFTLRTAEEVVSLEEGAPPLVATIRNLVERSVLRTIRGEPLPDSVMFASYQTIVPLIDRLTGHADGPDASRPADERAEPVALTRLRASAERFIHSAEAHARRLRSGAFSEGLSWLERHRADLAALSLRFAEQAPGLAAAATLVLLRLTARVGPLDELGPLTERAFELATAAGDGAQLAEARRCRAELAWIERRLDEAHREVELARPLVPVGHHHLEGDLLMLAARVARDRGEHEAAARANQLSVAAFQCGGDPHGEALALITSATGPAMDEASDGARAALERAAGIAARTGDTLLAGHVESALAIWHGNKGQPPRSIEHHRKALAHFTGAGDAGQCIRVLGYLGVALFDSGEREAGLAMIEQALDQARQFGLGATSESGRGGGESRSALNLRRLEAVARLMTIGGDHVVAGVTAGHLAALLIRRGELDAARAAYERGLRHVLNHPAEGRPAIHFQGLVASIDLGAGRFEAASEGYRNARRWLPGWEGPARAAIGSLLELTIDLCERRKLPALARDDGGVERLLAIMELAPRVSPVVAMGVNSLRLALFTSPIATPSSHPRLTIGAEGRWFQLNEEARVDLGRSGPICRILVALAKSAGGTSEPLGMMRLFEQGWPGERVSEGSAANRVYATLARLRTLGLRAVLLRRREGWLIDPEVRIELG